MNSNVLSTDLTPPSVDIPVNPFDAAIITYKAGLQGQLPPHFYSISIHSKMLWGFSAYTQVLGPKVSFYYRKYIKKTNYEKIAGNLAGKTENALNNPS